MGIVRDPYEPQAPRETGHGNHLSTPKQHNRSSSSYSHNYSLLDIYGLESPGSESIEIDLNKVDDSIPTEESSDLKHGTLIESIVSDLTKAARESTDLESHKWTLDPANPTVLISDDTAKGEVLPQKKLQINEDLKDSLKPNSSDHVRKQSSTKRKLSGPPQIAPIDKVSDLLQQKFDRYGFKKESSHHQITTADYNKWFSEYAQYSIRRKKKWLMVMKSNGLPEINHPTRFPPKSDKVKKLVRRGIPSEWRGAAWWFYAGGSEKLNKNIGVYDRVVEDTKDIHNKDTEVIERDLHRTFPDNIYFNASLESSEKDDDEETPMITSLRRVLTAFAHYQPLIGYCQSLNFLAGLLLLFMEEEKVFWMLVILTERIIPKVHSADLEGVHTDQGVLMLCIKEYIPQLWGILGKNFEGETLLEDKILTKLPAVTLVTSSWFMSLFVGILPIETVLRVWDILWYEGSKTIFRISLTIAKMCLDNPEFKKSNAHVAEIDQIELFQFMQSFPKMILDPNFLIDNCFKKIGGYGFGLVSQDEINKCREFVLKQRAKIKRQPGILANLTEEERRALIASPDGLEIHDVYGFHRSIMSGVVWNKNISNKMKKKFPKRVVN